MDLESTAFAISLGALGAALGVLSARAFVRAVRKRDPLQAMWGSGMAMATLAMAIETVVYVGYVSSLVLQLYVFASAVLVGLLSLGCLHVIHSARFARAYSGFMLGAFALLGAATFTTPLSASMVSSGIIAGSPPAWLLALSSVVTGPATVLLLAASAISLRHSLRWQTMLIIAGALVLGAGGTLYIASFPVFLYYAEFIGIALLLGGIISLPNPSSNPAAIGRPAGGSS